MPTAPLVSVLMAVYNGGPFLAEAVESVLSQSLTDWEFVVIDDGSTDGSGALLAQYAQRDRRLRVYAQENCGVIASLNRGLDLVQGRYLARLDADDVWLPARLARGVARLEHAPDLAILGSAYTIIDEMGRELRVDRPPTGPAGVAWQMLFHNPFCNSAVLLRCDLLVAAGLRYSPRALHGEDYDLWSRLLAHGQGANLAEPLVKYRRHGQQDSQAHGGEQAETATLIARRNLAELGLALPYDDVAALRQWYHALPTPLAPGDLRLVGLLLDALAALAARPGLPAAAVRRLRRTWFRRILAAAPVRPGGLTWPRLLWRMAWLDAPGLAAALAWSRRASHRPAARAADKG